MIKLIRKTVVLTAHGLGFWRLLYRLFHFMTGKYLLVVFSYHRVVDGKQTKDYYTFYDRGLDRATFERQVEGILRYFDIISLDRFVEVVTGRKELRRHSALITFDDADSDYVNYAFPILRARNLDAVVLAPTGLIESDQRLWHVRISNIVRGATGEQWHRIQQQAASLPDNIRKIVLDSIPENEPERRRLCRAINLAMDDVDHDAIDRIVEQWEGIVAPADVLGIKCMTWEQLSMMQENRSVVESHTVSHRKLTMLSEDEIIQELRDSKRQLEQKLNKTVTALSYPQGRHSDRVCALAREAGYQVGFITGGGVCDYPLQGLGLFKIPRLGVAGDRPSEVHFHFGKLALLNLVKDWPWKTPKDAC